MKRVQRIKETVRIAKRLVKRRLKPAAAILLYHCVADLDIDPFDLAVPPSHFAQHLAYIRQTCHSMRLIDLVEAVKQRSVPHRAVVVTFDDGYADNFSQARPLLESARVPATVFVVSGGIDSLRGFWWNDLERALLQPTQLPERLQLRVQGRKYEWPITNAGERQLAHIAIYRLLQPLPATERDRVLARLIDWAGPVQSEHPEPRLMTTAELIQLAQSELIDVGSHTVTHPLLSSLSPEEQYEEIVSSRQKLEAILGTFVDTFAYPFGNYTDESVEIVEAAGFRAALTCEYSTVVSGDNLFRLGRFIVNDWGGEEFERLLETFFRWW